MLQKILAQWNERRRARDAEYEARRTAAKATRDKLRAERSRVIVSFNDDLPDLKIECIPPRIPNDYGFSYEAPLWTYTAETRAHEVLTSMHDQGGVWLDKTTFVPISRVASFKIVVYTPQSHESADAS
jgi:hypothetical protein